MNWIKNIGTWLAIAGAILLIYIKLIAGREIGDLEDKVEDRKERIKTRNEENTKNKAARRKLKGKALHKRGGDILNG